MTPNTARQRASSPAKFHCAAIFAGLMLCSAPALAQVATCPVSADGSGMCKSEGNVSCSPPVGGRCYSTHTHSEWTCICATSKPVTMTAPMDSMAPVQPDSHAGSSNALLQIEGVSGESKEEGHSGWIALTSFSWGSSSPGRGESGMGARSGESTNRLTIVKYVDATSPTLMSASTHGKHYSEVMLAIRKAGRKDDRGPAVYLNYVLHDVMVSSVHMSSGGDRPTESVTFSFTKMEVKTENGGTDHGGISPNELPPPGMHAAPATTNPMLPPPGPGRVNP